MLSSIETSPAKGDFPLCGETAGGKKETESCSFHKCRGHFLIAKTRHPRKVFTVPRGALGETAEKKIKKSTTEVGGSNHTEGGIGRERKNILFLQKKALDTVTDNGEKG